MREQKTEVVNTVTAGMLQTNAAKFDCEIVEIGIAGENLARITVAGTAENLQTLFDYVTDAINEN